MEDHPIVSHALAMLVDNQSDLSACGSADSIREALLQFEKLLPDVVVVDISLADGNGLDLIKQLHDREPKTPILVLSMHEEAVYAERASCTRPALY